MKNINKINTSVSIVDTQIQLINVVELLNKIECQNNYLIVGGYSPPRIEQIKLLLKEESIHSKFKTVYFMQIRQSNSRLFSLLNSFYSLVSISIILFLHKNLNIGVIGNYLSPAHRYFQYICNKISENIVHFVVDDGANAIGIATLRIDEINQGKSKITLNTISSYIMYHFFLIKKNFVPPKITFFSIYNMAYVTPDNLIVNDCNYIRNNALAKINIEQDSIVIVGQCLVVNNAMTKADYIKYINYIISINYNKRIYYFPHPAEKCDVKDFKSNINIVSNSYPIEIALISSPDSIIIFGLYSSALYSIKRMKKETEVNALIINPVDILSPRLVPILENVYKSFEEIGIQLIPMPARVVLKSEGNESLKWRHSRNAEKFALDANLNKE